MEDTLNKMAAYRCGECDNCKKLERVKARVLACANPPFSHASDDLVDVWNRELGSLPCVRVPFKRSKDRKELGDQ